MKKTLILCLSVFLVLALCFTGCTGQNTTTAASEEPVVSESTGETSEVPEESVAAKEGSNPEEELSILEDTVLTAGPYDEEPYSIFDLEVSDENLEKIKASGLTAGIAMHYMGNDWSNACVSGITDQLEAMGVEVVGVTDANFSPDKQTSDIESLLARDIDILISLPTDPVAMAPVFKSAAEKGVKVVYMSQISDGAVPGDEYVTVVCPDDLSNGAAAAHIMAREMNCEGEIGIVFYDVDYPTTNHRYQGFKETIQNDYPNIEIVAEQGISADNLAGAAEIAAGAFLTQYPDLDGIFGIWDVPAEGIIAAAKTAGRDDLIVTTEDLGLNMAINMAEGGMVKGLGGQLCYDMGVAEAKSGALACIGEEVPVYLAANALIVDQSNIAESWEKVYHTDLPTELQDVLAE